MSVVKKFQNSVQKHVSLTNVDLIFEGCKEISDDDFARIAEALYILGKINKFPFDTEEI